MAGAQGPSLNAPEPEPRGARRRTSSHLTVPMASPGCLSPRLPQVEGVLRCWARIPGAWISRMQFGSDYSKRRPTPNTSF